MTTKVRPEWFLGTNYGHDAAAALIDRDGRLTFAVEEGRLVAEKNCARFPSLSLQSALENATESVVWAEGWDWNRRLAYKGINTALRHMVSEPRMLQHRLWKEFRRYAIGTASGMLWSRTIGAMPIIVGHHLAHALSVMPCGLQDNSLVLVSDTTGERESVTIFYWDGTEMRRLVSSPWPNSPGGIFHQAAYFAGFPGERGPGKLMALSGYGRPRRIDVLERATRIHDGRVIIDTRIFPAYRYGDAWDRALRDAHLGDGWISPMKHAQEAAADFAASIQDWFERTLLELVASAYSLARSQGLEVSGVALAGGAALNCQANGRLYRQILDAGWGDLIVSPWSNDAGTAIGAAVFAARHDGGVTDFSVATPLLGPVEPVEATGNDDAIEAATRALSRGDVIGLISGGVEFGPRALGGRAILADARRTGQVERLNDLKGRPSFMPFAPALREEIAAEWFDGKASHDMAWTVPIRARTLDEFPGLYHPTGEARVQAVRQARAPLLWELLRRCEEAGMPILLLTSLNGAGEPMLASADSSMNIARSLGVDGVLCDQGWFGING